MGYIEQLHTIYGGGNTPDKKMEIPLGANLKNLKNPPEGSNLGFLGSGNSTFAKKNEFAVVDAPCWRWKIFFTDHEPLEVCFSPPVSRDEVLEWPGAVSAEPLATNVRQQSAPLAAGEEAAVRAWLAQIGETDSATIDEVIEGCRRDKGARGYFIRRAAAETLKG
jgi:hypothetical protein